MKIEDPAERKLIYSFIFYILIVMTSIILGIFSSHFLFHDNPIEQISEQVIKYHTGIDLDFSPEI